MNKPHEATTVELRVELASTREALRMAVGDLQREQVAHAKARNDFRLTLGVLIFNTVLLIVLAVKYLHIVDLPKPRCLHPGSFAPTHLELATVTEAPRQTV